MSILKEMKTPVFKVEGIQEIDKDEYVLTIIDSKGGESKLKFDEIQGLPQTTINLRMTSVSGWSVRANWQGVLWKDMMEHLGIKEDKRFVLFESSGGYLTNAYPEDILPERWLFCHSVDGEPLEAEYGGPLRMIIPNLWGYKCCKWLTKVSFLKENEPGYWETHGYEDRGLIEPGITLDINTREKREIEGGEVTDF